MIEHRRSDGELLGWIVEFGDGFHVLDLLGRQHTEEPVDWLAAEELLDSLGVPYTKKVRDRDIKEICGKVLKKRCEKSVEFYLQDNL